MQNNVWSIDPATGRKVRSYALDNDQQVLSKVQATQKAYTEWSGRTHQERAEALGRVGRHVREMRQSIAEMITQEIGMPIGQSIGEVDKAIQLIDEVCRNGPTQLAPRQVPSAKSRIEYAALGVCLSVAPWNFPFYLALRSIIPNLMAGNTVLLKHSVTCQGVAGLIEECFRVDGMPAHVVTNLAIRGLRAENALRYPEVKVATLIGSERAGRSFAAAAAAQLKKVVLELGGNDALVVLADADIPVAAKAAAESRLRNCGQACNAAKRYLVDESVRDEFVRLLTTEYNKFVPGDPRDPKVQMGPIATEEAAKSFLGQCATLEKHGKLLHEVAFQFNPTEQQTFDVGYWVTPRLYEITDTKYTEEEIFGPAATLQTFRTTEEALQLINGSRFGLGCSIWTADRPTFEMMAKRVETGNVFLNSMVRSHVGLPYGGVKDSGYGRELGEEGLRELCNVKVVYTG